MVFCHNLMGMYINPNVDLQVPGRYEGNSVHPHRCVALYMLSGDACNGKGGRGFKAMWSEQVPFLKDRLRKFDEYISAAFL